ncbi:MAG: molybdopterin molybdenumtransferase MoeA, partial [Nitratireductor sp.]
MNVDSAIDPSCCGCGHSHRSRDMLSVAQAADLARSLVAPVLDTEAVAIADACGRVAAYDVHAPRPMPFFDQSAMDGFCVRIADLAGQGPWRMPVAATIAAGDRPSRGDWRAGTATRVFTGAPGPAGADAVVMNEDCDDEGGHVCLHRHPRRGDNIRRRGGDVADGALLVAAETCIAPRHVGLLAANG